jgi:YD repeat-containing protein
MLAVTLMVTAGVPGQGGLRTGSAMPSWSGIWSWFTATGAAWAHAPLPPTPRQLGGTAAGGSARVASAATRAGGGNGRAPGVGRGELPAFSPHLSTAKPSTTGLDPADGAARFNPSLSKRLAGSATATSDLYANPDGSYTRVISAAPRNYRGSDGAWHPIDTRVSRAGNGRVQVAATSGAMTFGASANDPSLVTVQIDAGHTLSYGLAGAAGVAPTVDGSTATYSGVLPQTDLQLESIPAGLTESLILHSAQAPTSWVFPLQLAGLTARVTADQTVEFVDAQGTVVGSVPHAYMRDSNRNPASGRTAESHDVTYSLVTVDGHPALQMTADASWIQDPSRVFPIIVDPSYTNVETGNTAVLTDQTADMSGDFDMDIGTWNNGGEIGKAFVAFSNVGSNLYGMRITSATLDVFDYEASSCTPTRFDVAPITQSWPVTGVKAWPGPPNGPSIGNLTADPGAACTNTSNNESIGVWMDVPLSTQTFNTWTTGGPNYGLVLYGPSTGYNGWKRLDTIRTSLPAQLVFNYTPDVPPQIDSMYPPSNYNAPTLTPELIAFGHDPDNWPSPITYTYTVYSTDGTQLATSGAISSNSWVIPPGTLKWGQTYYWSVLAFDGVAYSTTTSASYFTTTVPQPLVTSGLSQNTGEHGFDPAAGNYTTAVADAQVQTVGPTLSVQRDYNSLDPRTAQAFGAGWSSLYDMRAAEVSDASGTVTGVIITYPTGEEIEFGRNHDGTFVAPQGRYATLTSLSSPAGYQLVDKNATTYSFTQTTATSGTYALTGIVDAQGRAESFSYASGQLTTATSVASGRALHFTWTTPAGATAAHVQSVVTDPTTPGNSATALTWTYGYSGDQLTSVCPPGTTTACTGYAYTGGSHYHTTVVDAGPRGYWRLADLPNGTVAADQMLVNEGTLAGTYTTSSMSGTAAGPLGNGLTSPTFDGATTAVRLKDNLTAGVTYLSVGLWFKTSSTSAGTLFSTGFSAPGTSNPSPGSTPVLYVGSDGKLYGHFWNQVVPGIASTTTVNDGVWHYAVLTGAGNTQSLYLDGALVGTLAGQIGDPNPLDLVGAGVYNNNGWPAAPSGNTWNYFAGNIAEVAYYTRPLPASVIAAQWSTARPSSNLLTSITRPSGKTDTTVAYHGFDDAVTSLTDSNGGTWSLGTPWVSGSSQSYVSSVLGSAPMDYWRFGETGVSQAVNQVHGATATYNAVTLGAAGAFGTGPGADTAGAFNGTSSYVSLPTNTFPTGASSQEAWFNTTTSGQILLSSQAGAAGSTTCPCLPAMWITADGKLRALSPSTSPNGPLTAVGLPGECIDLNNGSSTNGTKIQVWGCGNANPNQDWTLYPDGTIRSRGKCWDINNGGTGNGTLVQLWDCNNGVNQKWQPYNGGFRNPNSGRCLDDPNRSTTNGTQFQIYDCNGTPAQQWIQSLQTSGAVNDGRWHHTVLTTDGTSQWLYLDGALAYSTAQSSTGSVPLTPGGQAYAYVGTGYTGVTATGLALNTTTYFSGSMEELATYPTTLTATDVARHYTSAKSVYGIAPVQSVQVGAPGSVPATVATFTGTTYLASQNQQWNVPAATLAFQSDGNLVAYRRGTTQPIWSSNTGGHSSAMLAFQGDGNLVIYSDSTATTVLWTTYTEGHSGNTAVLQPNGELAVDDSAGRQLWSSYPASPNVTTTLPPLSNAPHVLTYLTDPLSGGRPLASIDALGNQTSYGYDMYGFLHTVTDH